jgi:ribose transport system substrate-binding protein
MKKKIVALIITGLMLLSLVGCGTSNSTATSNTPAKKDKPTVAFLMGLPPFGWAQQYVDDIKADFEKNKKNGVIKDYKLYLTKSDEEANAALNDALNNKIDAIGILPMYEDSISASVAKLVAAGTKVETMGASYPGTLRMDGDYVKFQQIPTQYVLSQMGGKGNVVRVSGPAGESNSILYDSVMDGVLKEYPNGKQVAKVNGDYDATKSNQAVAAILSAHPEKIDGMIGITSGAWGAMKAFIAANRPVPIMVGDDMIGFLRYMKDHPEINAMIPTYVPGVGAAITETMIRQAQGKKINEAKLEPVPGKNDGSKHINLPTPYFIVRKVDMNADYLKGMDPRTKVITLEDALKTGEGKPDTWVLDFEYPAETIDAYFQ